MYRREEERCRSPSANRTNERFFSRYHPYQGPTRNTFIPNSIQGYDALSNYQHRATPHANPRHETSTSYHNQKNNGRCYTERGDRRGVSPVNRRSFAGIDRREWQSGEKRRHDFEDHHRKIRKGRDNDAFDSYKQNNRHEVGDEDNFPQKRRDFNTNSNQHRRAYVSGRPPPNISTNENEVATAPVPLMSLNFTTAFQARGTGSETHCTDDDNCRRSRYDQYNNDSRSNSKTSFPGDSRIRAKDVLENSGERAEIPTSNAASKAAVATSSSDHPTSNIVSGNQERLEQEVSIKIAASAPGDLHSSDSTKSQINPTKSIWQWKIPKRNAVRNKLLDLRKSRVVNKVKDKKIIHRSVTRNPKPSTSGSSKKTRVSKRVMMKDLRTVLKKIDIRKILGTKKTKIVRKTLPTKQVVTAEIQNSVEFKFLRDPYMQIKFLFYLRSALYKNMKFSLLSEVVDPTIVSDQLFRFENTLHSVICEVKYMNVENVGLVKDTLPYKTMSNVQFDIKKYFSLFLKCKIDNSHKELKKIVIYCNLGWNRAVFYKNKIQISNDNENLIKFQVLNPFRDGQEHDWYKKFLECCTLPNLAKEIAHCMDKKKVHFNTKVMKKYLNSLVRERVIKMQTEKKDDKDANIAKFHEDFLKNHNLSRPALLLRCYVIKNIGKERLSEKYFSISNLFEISSEASSNLPDEDSELLFEEFFTIFRYCLINNNYNEYDKFLSIQFAEAESVEYLSDIQRVTLESIHFEKSLDDTMQSLEKLISKCKIIRKSLKEITKVNVVFEDETLIEVKNHLGNGDRRIMHLCLTESVSLTTLIIKQISKNRFLYTANQEALFVSGDVLLEMIDNVIDVLILDSTKLLTIQWNEDDYDEVGKSAFAKIQTVLNNLPDKVKKSVIIVAKIDNKISQMGGVKIFDTENSFKLTLESQNEIFRLKNVMLQNRQTSLLDLMDVAAAKTLIKMPEVLEALVFGELNFENELSEPFWLKENYFNPQLKQRVIIDKKIFQEGIHDVFCIKNPENKKIENLISADNEIFDSKEFPLNAKFIMLDPHIDNYSLIFEHFQHRPVHIFNYVDYKFVWQMSHGSIAPLLKHKLDHVDALINSSPIEDVLSAGPKTIIISGDSGMGKSTYLYNLSRRVYTTSRSEVDNSVWVVYVDVDKLNIRVPPKTSDEAIELLATHLRFKNAQKKLFVMSAKGELKLKIALFIEGCDDLPSEDLKAPTKLLQKLQETCIQKIVVTSRSDNTLEAELGVFSYQLQFSNDQKIELLQNYWNESSDVAEKANNFIKYYENGNGKADFTSTPLHLIMLAEINKEKNELVPLNYYHDLYERYVNLIVKVDSNVQVDKMSVIEKLLMQKMMRDKVTIELNDKDISDLPKNLFHRSFAEYFIARNLSICCISTNNSTYNLFIPLIDNTFIDGVSRVFLDTLLPLLTKNNNIETFMNKLAQDGYLQFLKATLKYEKIAKPCLHDLIKSNDREKSRNFKNTTLGTLSFVLKHYNSTGDDEITRHGEVKPEYIGSNIFDYVNSRKQNSTPLQVAISLNKVDLACELLLYGASISDIEDGHQEFVLKIANYVVLKTVGGENRFYSILERLLMLIPAEEATKLCRQNCFKILSYFFTNGRIKIIKRLLSDPDDRSEFINSCPADQSPVDLINTSQELNDEERRKMIEYVSNNFGDDHIKNNIHQILRSACRYKHWHAFTYSVGNNQNDFLKSILHDNDHEILDFLKGRGKKYLSDKEGKTALHYAITLEVSPWTINKAAEVCGIDDTDDDGMTALHLAFWKGTNLALIRYLIESKNASLIQKDKYKLYPWCYILINEFCRYDKRQVLEIMEYLLTKGVDAPNYMEPNIVNDAYIKEVRQKFKYYSNLKNIDSDNIDEDIPPLYLALKDKVKENWCKFLIAQIRDINATNSEGKTCLHSALYYKRYQLVKLILQRGAIIDSIDNNGMTPLQILQSAPETTKDYKDMKNLLELAEKIFSDRKALRDNLSMTFSRFNKSPVRYLINCRNKKRQSLYHVAASFGSASSVVYLAKLNEKCRDNYEMYEPRDINDQDEDGNTALHIAAEKGPDKVVSNLLCYGASFEITNCKGQMPADLTKGKSIFRAVDALFVAVKSQDLDKARKSLENNRSYLVNARDEFGKCSLHYANDAAMMKLLVRKFSEAYKCQLFIDMEVVDFDFRSPLYYAAEGDYLECARLLLRAGDSIELKNFNGERNSTVELLRDIEMLFDDVNSEGPKYFTNENTWQLAGFLKNKCRDVIVNARDKYKNTLLHYAAKYNFTKAIEILLKNGAVYNAANLKKEVPQGLNKSVKNIFENLNKLFKKLDLAAWRDIKLDPEIIVNCRKSDGYTLLYKAVKACKMEEKEWLIELGASLDDTDDFGNDVRSVLQISALG